MAISVSSHDYNVSIRLDTLENGISIKTEYETYLLCPLLDEFDGDRNKCSRCHKTTPEEKYPNDGLTCKQAPWYS
jgi:hypothetical protein